jgi:hypothetical protein
LAAAAPDPTTHDTGAKILVDIRFADSGQPFSSNFELTKLTPDVWRGDVPPLPRNQQRRFAARALSASGGVAFSGETLATLTVGTRAWESSWLRPRTARPSTPRMFRIIYPTEIFAGAESSLAFCVHE